MDRRVLRKKGITTARLDAEVLLAHCLGVDRLHLYLNLDRPLRQEERIRYRELIRRRAMREPVALIRGVKEFWSLRLRAAPGVLIPRPDTEALVEAVLEELRDRPVPNILEIGTGSGAIAVAIALENPRARIVATDIDKLALEAALKRGESGRFSFHLLHSFGSIYCIQRGEQIRRGLLQSAVYSKRCYRYSGTGDQF